MPRGRVETVVLPPIEREGPPETVSGFGEWVYRCYGAAGELLYVGYTSRLRTRLVVHRRVALWFDEVACIRAVNHAGRYAAETVARAEELQVIREDRPRYNWPKRHALIGPKS